MYAPANQLSDFHFNVNDSRQKLTVLVGLCGDSDTLGLFFFDGNVNGLSYLNLLNGEVVPLMAVLLGIQFHEHGFQRLWWVQDGIPYYRLLAVRGRLNQLFGERVLSLHNNTEWPPGSTDLTPFNFFLICYLKDKVFGTPPESLSVLRRRIINECNVLRENKDLIRRSVQHMRNRADTFVQRGEGYVEWNL